MNRSPSIVMVPSTARPMEQSRRALLRPHEIFPYFHSDGGWRSPADRFIPSCRLEIPFVDLSGRPEDEREAVALAMATGGCAPGHSTLPWVPLLRARIVSLGRMYHRL